MKGGEKLFFPLWTASFPLSLNPLSPPVTPHGIQCLYHFVYSPLKLPDTSGRAHSAKDMPMSAKVTLWSTRALLLGPPEVSRRPWAEV